jgi:DNA-binding transcriptional ArsR family regulator
VETLQDFKAGLFRTLANPVRIRILEVLRLVGSLTVGEIQLRVGIEAANASQHLAILRGQGIVSAKREGTSVWYSVSDQEVFELLDAARAIFERRVAAQAELLAESDRAELPARS